MGRGSSKVGRGGGGAAKLASTPSGISYDQFMKMSEQQRFNIIGDILENPNIKTPDYLDDSDTTKVLYGLGMTNKPTVVSDAQLDSMPGKELFRTVYEAGTMPPPSSDAILDQIANGDYTQMSGSGGSAHGRAIYFATNFGESASYGHGRRNPYVGRAKVNPNAKIVTESNLSSQMRAKGIDPGHYNYTTFGKATRVSGRDAKALFALSQGIDGWYNGTYTMMVNRGALTMSDSFKSLHGTYKVGAKKGQPKPGYAKSWNTAG